LKKTFLLTDPRKDSQRVLEAVKSNIKKYIKREKRKELPEGSNFWKIDCKFGTSKETAIEIRFEDIMKNINEVFDGGQDSFYIELTSSASNMKLKKVEPKIQIEESSQGENINENVEV